MAWNTGVNYNTNTLLDITYPISKDDLQKGDILLKRWDHAVIFHSWAYLGYELAGGGVGMVKKWNIPYQYWRGARGYETRRYNGIQ